MKKKNLPLPSPLLGQLEENPEDSEVKTGSNASLGGGQNEDLIRGQYVHLTRTEIRSGRKILAV